MIPADREAAYAAALARFPCHPTCPQVTGSGGAKGPCTCTRAAGKPTQIEPSGVDGDRASQTAQLASHDARRWQEVRDAKSALAARGKHWRDARFWALGVVQSGRFTPADAPPSPLNPRVVEAYVVHLDAAGARA